MPTRVNVTLLDVTVALHYSPPVPRLFLWSTMHSKWIACLLLPLLFGLTCQSGTPSETDESLGNDDEISNHLKEDFEPLNAAYDDYVDDPTNHEEFRKRNVPDDRELAEKTPTENEPEKNAANQTENSNGTAKLPAATVPESSKDDVKRRRRDLAEDEEDGREVRLRLPKLFNLRPTRPRENDEKQSEKKENEVQRPRIDIYRMLLNLLENHKRRTDWRTIYDDQNPRDILSRVRLALQRQNGRQVVKPEARAGKITRLTSDCRIDEPGDGEEAEPNEKQSRAGKITRLTSDCRIDEAERALEKQL